MQFWLLGFSAAADRTGGRGGCVLFCCCQANERIAGKRANNGRNKEDILENKIVLIVPIDVASVAGFEDLTNDNVEIFAMGETKSVPAGQYSEEVLKKLNLMDPIMSKTVFGKDVKEVLTWVETGNADAGMVYETDSIISKKVKVAAYAPEGSHRPIVYPAAVIKDSKNIDASRDFMGFICSVKAKSLFEKYGFTFVAEQ